MSELVSPIDAWHLRANAKMADFGGWSMPIEYPAISIAALKEPSALEMFKTVGINSQGIGNELVVFEQNLENEIKGGVIDEHNATRNAAGLFDVSHLGKILISVSCGCKDNENTNIVKFLNDILTNDLSKLKYGQAQYNLLCNINGGVIDDLIVYLIDDSNAFLIPNASNNDEVFEVLENFNKISGNYFKIENQHQEYAIFALQGPKSFALLENLAKDQTSQSLFAQIWGENWFEQVTQLGYMYFAHNNDAYICRTGYTGELGVEFVVPTKKALAVWNKLTAQIFLEPEARIVGLGARDTLRTEMGYPLHGHEITPEISPLRGGASWALALDKPKFFGKDAILSLNVGGTSDRLRGIELIESGVLRAGMFVLSLKDESIGYLTSGTYSPTLKTGIGLALVSIEYQVNDEVYVQVRSRKLRAKIVKLPFVQSKVK